MAHEPPEENAMGIHGARTGGRRASKGSLGSPDARCIKMIENISTITMVSARASEVITSSSETEGNKFGASGAGSMKNGSGVPVWIAILVHGLVHGNIFLL